MPHSTDAPVREQRSLFGEILDWMLAPLLLLWPMSIFLTYLVAQTIADRPFDREDLRTIRGSGYILGKPPAHADTSGG